MGRKIIAPQAAYGPQAAHGPQAAYGPLVVHPCYREKIKLCKSFKVVISRTAVRFNVKLCTIKRNYDILMQQFNKLSPSPQYTLKIYSEKLSALSHKLSENDGFDIVLTVGLLCVEVEIGSRFGQTYRQIV